MSVPRKNICLAIGIMLNKRWLLFFVLWDVLCSRKENCVIPNQMNWLDGDYSQKVENQ